MMSLARTLMLSAFALTAEVTTAFAPVGRVLITPSTLGSNTAAAKVMNSPDLTTLSMSNTDPDLAVGFVTIAAACTPYVLGTIFPTFFNDGFFLPVYKADDTGRVAEIGWKVRYATLGLALTALAFYEVYFADKQVAAGILRDSYILWAIFYAEATRKIRAEATADPPILANPSGRLGIQVWHLLVTIILWADVSESYTGQAITNFLTELFPFN